MPDYKGPFPASAKLPLSAFVITLNEADRIANCLHTLQSIASEIIVIDSGSTDATVEICQALGAKVIHHAWPGYGPQKRFAEEQCHYDWLLNLDADEWLSEGLIEEIKRLFQANKPLKDAYFLKCVHWLPGEASLPYGYYAQKMIRLYRKSRGRYANSLVHDRVEMAKASTTGILSQPFFHQSARSISHSIDKLNSYSSLQIKDIAKRKRRIAGYRLYTEFAVAFLKAYFGRRYCLRGKNGFIFAMLYAFSRFVRIAKYEEFRQQEK